MHEAAEDLDGDDLGLAALEVMAVGEGEEALTDLGEAVRRRPSSENCLEYLPCLRALRLPRRAPAPGRRPPLFLFANDEHGFSLMGSTTPHLL